MSVPRFSLRAAAALFIERQQLTRPRAQRLTAPGLSRFVAGTGGLQLDSINVIERAHYLTLWSRFGVYDRGALDRMVYKRRVLFEYFAHVACLVSTEHLPAWRRAMLDYHPRDSAWKSFLKKHRPTFEAVEAAIRDRGPLGNADFEHRRKPGEASGWWEWKPATHALDYLWKSGRITVGSRVHFHKRFDLMERVFPKAFADEPLSSEAFWRWHLTQSLHAMGAATETDLRTYLSTPRIKAPQRRAVLQSMVREGEVVEIALDGDRGRWFALRRDLDALAAAGRRRQPSSGATFLSPFDSFLWHRERTLRLFGYDYRIEVYVPSHRRTHGYYALPILVDGHLIGRVDAKTHRAERRLELRRIHFEPWFVAGERPPAAAWGTLDRDAVVAGIAASAHSLAHFVGADRVSLKTVVPAALRAPIIAALESAPRAATVSAEAATT